MGIGNRNGLGERTDAGHPGKHDRVGVGFGVIKDNAVDDRAELAQGIVAEAEQLVKQAIFFLLLFDAFGSISFK